MTDAARAFLDYKRQEQCDPETIAQYDGHLERWSAWRAAQGHSRDLAAVTFEEIRLFFSHLGSTASPDRGSRKGQPGLSPATQRAYHRTCSTFWRWLRQQRDERGAGLLAVEQLYYFDRGMIPLPPISERERPAISEVQFKALLATAGDGSDEESARNVAILWGLWDTGARVHELAGMHQADVDLVEMEARIIGKGRAGGKEGMLFWTPRTNAAIKRYLLLRRGPLSGPLFRGCNSRNQGEACTPNLIRCMVKALARRAGVALPSGSPCHAFRHAFARRMRAAGLSKVEVGELLRDSTPAVIDRYLGLDVEPRRALYRRAHGLRVEARRRSAEG